MKASDGLIGQNVSHSGIVEKQAAARTLSTCKMTTAPAEVCERMREGGMPDHTTAAPQYVPTHLTSMSALSLAALGVVFGDIGTSPLYTLKTVLDITGPHPGPAAILGSLSLILWTLIIVTSVKYVTIALRVDNGGEGGILALMALLRSDYPSSCSSGSAALRWCMAMPRSRQQSR